MQNLMTMIFEAHHAERNHHRRYQVVIGRDLFHDLTVSICYGRTGQGGHELRYGGMHTSELQAIVQERLRRRLSAPKRIGCGYRLTSLSAAPGFDTSTWLPASLMSEFS